MSFNKLRYESSATAIILEKTPPEKLSKFKISSENLGRLIKIYFEKEPEQQVDVFFDLVKCSKRVLRDSSTLLDDSVSLPTILSIVEHTSGMEWSATEFIFIRNLFRRCLEQENEGWWSE